MLAKMGHDGLHGQKPFCAFEGEALKGVLEGAVFGIELMQYIHQGKPFGFIVGKHFADEKRGIDTILIAHKGAGKIAIALLKPPDIALRMAFLLQ